MKRGKAFFLSFFISLILAFGAASCAVFVLYQKIEGTKINEGALVLNVEPTQILDANGKPLVKFYKNRRSLAKYEELPKEIVDAVLSTEDKKFFEHPGFSLKAMLRAAISIAMSKGEIVQGGSTLTQQVVKNTMLDTSKTYQRKFWEVVYASVLEQKYSKEEIFELYVNHFGYLYNAYGMKDAMMTYFAQDFKRFQKLPREERIAKAALLVGMLKNPILYDPFTKPENALKRRNLVIENMKNNNKITEEEYQKAIKLPLMVPKQPKKVFEDEKIHYEELVSYALKEAADILKKDISDVMNGGYIIQTSFNTDVYQILREEFEKSVNFPANAIDGTKVEGAMVILNAKTGDILAFTGGRQAPKFLEFNRAYMLKKQPGSSIKPIIAYGPALESGKFTPYSKLLDQKGYVFPGGYVVKDWDNGGRGWVTMQEAIRQSWNIPAVWTLQQVGLNYAKEYAKKLGLDLSKENTLGIAIGGLKGGVSPLEMADAYQAFANNGIRTPAHAVVAIKNYKNETIYKREINQKAVISPKNAKSMKEMLRNTVSRGVARSARIPGREIAGKTGTVQHPLNDWGVNSDIWFVGFDEQVLGSVWMGFDKINPKRYLLEGSERTAKMFAKVMKRILDYYEKHGKLATPEPIEEEKKDETPPKIALNGDSTVYLYTGEEYMEEGASAKDETDGDLTKEIKMEGNVDTDNPGTYTIAYSVSDKSGNESKITRTVVIKERPNIKLEIYPYNKNNAIILSWNKIEDEVYYQIQKNNIIIAETESNDYLDTMLENGSAYEYKVIVMDKKRKIPISESETVSIITQVTGLNENVNVIGNDTNVNDNNR